ncbi:hypothetical protein [Escherichia coli]|uniref:hypothetical protein n=1 Tax=Escherichia coli TaxID=562 RepID=UPI0038911854
MNTFSVSRLALTLAFGVTLTACSSTPPDQRPSDQTAPGTSSRPILSAKEAQNFDAQHYFASLTPVRQRGILPRLPCLRNLTLLSAGGYSRCNAYHDSGGGRCGNYQAYQQAPVYCRDAR